MSINPEALLGIVEQMEQAPPEAQELFLFRKKQREKEGEKQDKEQKESLNQQMMVQQMAQKMIAQGQGFQQPIEQPLSMGQGQVSSPSALINQLGMNNRGGLI